MLQNNTRYIFQLPDCYQLFQKFAKKTRESIDLQRDQQKKDLD